MFELPTVFVVGAGASARWSFPIGGALRGEIAGQLNVEFSQQGHPVGNLTPVVDAYANRATRDKGRLSNVLKSMRSRLFAYDSVDEFIDAQQDEELTELAKLSIAHVIGYQEAEAERQHFLLTSAASDGFQQRLYSSWLGSIATRMVSGVRVKQNAEDIGKNVCFVIFNYDRSVEHFLHAWLAQLGLGTARAAEIVNAMSIYHPYGTIGGLPWQFERTKFEFGRIDDLYEASQSLRTFTEQIEDTSDLVSLRLKVAEAARVVFLGFGFHKQNMEILAPKKPDAARHVYATVWKTPIGERKRIEGALRSRFDTYSLVLEDDDCDTFASSYMRLIAAS